MKTIDDGDAGETIEKLQCSLFFVILPHRVVDLFFDYALLREPQAPAYLPYLWNGVDMIADGNYPFPFAEGPLPAPGQCRGMVVRKDHVPSGLEYPCPFA